MIPVFLEDKTLTTLTLTTMALLSTLNLNNETTEILHRLINILCSLGEFVKINVIRDTVNST